MIIKDINQLRRSINCSAATSYERLAPHLANAETKYLRPAIGRKMLEKLNEIADRTNLIEFPDFQIPGKYKPDFEVPELEYREAAALRIASIAVANLAYFVGFDVLTAYISDGGFKRTEGENVKSLFKYQEYNLKSYYQNAGLTAIDLLLTYLQKNIAFFPDFADKGQELRGRIFPDTASFEKIVNISNSPLIFAALQHKIKMVEDMELLPILGKANFDFIISELRKAAPAPKVLQILPFIQNPLAWLAVAALMEETGATLGDRGLFYQRQPGTDEKLPTPDPRLNDVITRNKITGQRYLAALMQYLQNNQNDWGKAEHPRSFYPHARDNSNRRSFWV